METKPKRKPAWGRIIIALLLLSGVAAQETKKYLWSNRLDDEMEE